MRVECKNIKYDFDGQKPVRGLPKSMTVEVDDSYMSVFDDPYDMEDAVEDVIEEKVGFPVLSFQAQPVA